MPLTLRYVTALGIVATLILSAAALTLSGIARQRGDAAAVNIAGRQRMLSERIVRASLQWELAKDPAARHRAERQLRESIRLLSASHVLLQAGDDGLGLRGDLAVETQAMFTRLTPRIDSLTAAASDVLGSDPRAIARLQAVQPRFVEEMEAAVEQLQADAERRVDDLRRTVYLIVTVLLGTLVSVGVFVFRPAVQSLRESVSVLRDANRDLDAALIDAETAAKMKSEFLATMSHELRTPLNAVIGLSGLLLDTEMDARQRTFAINIHRSGEGLLGLVNDVLDLSKIEAGKLDLEAIPFQPREIVEGTAETLALRVEEKGLEILTLLEDTVPHDLIGDPGRLRQILLNLVGNAVKFTEHGHVLIRVRPVAMSGELCRLRFEVEDTGIGITPAALSRLFQPFAQADASTTRRFGGTGLGLNISRLLAERMGGTIGATSIPGAGSIFFVEIPFSIATEVESTSAEDFAGFAGRRALIVDDIAANRLVLRHLLMGWGMQVEEAVDAFEARRLLSRMDVPLPEIIVTDWQMPVEDGYSFVKSLKAATRWAEIPVVMLTSFSRSGDDTVAAASGMAAVLSKPVRRGALRQALVAAMRGETVLAAPVVTPTVSRWTGRKVLVVDDNPVNLMVARALCEQRGLQVVTATDGAEALAALLAHDVDLILMDVQMPVLDGRAATRELRRREAGRRHTTVIALTAAAMDEDRSACLEAGMDDYLSKPIVPARFDSALVKWLGPPTA